MLPLFGPLKTISHIKKRNYTKLEELVFNNTFNEDVSLYVVVKTWQTPDTVSICKFTNAWLTQIQAVPFQPTLTTLYKSSGASPRALRKVLHPIQTPTANGPRMPCHEGFTGLFPSAMGFRQKKWSEPQTSYWVHIWLYLKIILLPWKGFSHILWQIKHVPNHQNMLIFQLWHGTMLRKHWCFRKWNCTFQTFCRNRDYRTVL